MRNRLRGGGLPGRAPSPHTPPPTCSQGSGPCPPQERALVTYGEAGGHLDAGAWLPVPLAVFREGVGRAGTCHCPGPSCSQWPEPGEGPAAPYPLPGVFAGWARPSSPSPPSPASSFCLEAGPFWVLLGPSGFSWHRSGRCVPRIMLSPKVHVLWPWARTGVSGALFLRPMTQGSSRWGNLGAR